MLHTGLRDRFTIFLCFPACLQVLLFSHSLWHGPSLSLHLHAIWQGGVGAGEQGYLLGHPREAVAEHQRSSASQESR